MQSKVKLEWYNIRNVDLKLLPNKSVKLKKRKRIEVSTVKIIFLKNPNALLVH